MTTSSPKELKDAVLAALADPNTAATEVIPLVQAFLTSVNTKATQLGWMDIERSIAGRCVEHLGGMMELCINHFDPRPEAVSFLGDGEMIEGQPLPFL